MNAVEEVRKMFEDMAARKDEMTEFKGLLGEISIALGSIVECMEKEEKGDDQAVVTALVQGLQGLSIKAPEIQVNVPAAQVSVTVQPAQVVVMPPGESTKGWVLTVTGHDGNGRVRTMSFKPEN